MTTPITDPEELVAFGVTSEILKSLAAKAMRLEIDGGLVRIWADFPAAAGECLYSALLRNGQVRILGILDFLLGFTIGVSFSKYSPEWQAAVDRYALQQPELALA